MAANKTRERLTGIELKMPAAAVIAPGDVLVFGPAAGPTLIGIANDGQNMTTKPPYYSNSGYLALDTEGAFNIQTSAVATNITPGTPIYVHLGTTDATTNISYGNTVNNTATGGLLMGLAESTLASGTSGAVRVSLKDGIS
jgi:hypothetical protein